MHSFSIKLVDQSGAEIHHTNKESLVSASVAVVTISRNFNGSIMPMVYHLSGLTNT